MKTINWGIIGCGNVCEKKSGPSFYKIEHSNLVAVMRRDPDKVKDYAMRHKVDKYYTDADQLIADPQVDAVYIATPPNTHMQYAIKAMQAGKPVYVEKPMGMNSAECEEMIRTSETTNQKLFVAFYRRALPYFLKVKELLESEVIGNVLTVEVKQYRSPRVSDLTSSDHTWRVDKDIAGEGYFYDLAPHTLDILDFLLGEITDAKGFSANLGQFYEVKDTISAILKFKSGIIGSGRWCFVTSAQTDVDSIIITGTKGEIRFSTFDFSPILLLSDTASESFDIPSPEHIQQPLIQTIVDELRGVGKCPSTGVSGARTSRVMDLILNT
ncbi:Gfo/Idh/MocA family oxidoreductase [Dysgonomonas sp. HDW5B]|uniref:Gfo/Idh/MocA family protein n=1 Tax=Dysgonomonas sp. HDW5B TaxID=2714927 RepID=UPI0014085C2C|nr:Gfo/Idh/MocA family oxidoreductase [Dysgonomonas sp. HDW5B]QIK54299.1 Gfo/Idh/MocA family oxidoreductase [Dysgonomonas sp. HDW5B]